LLESVHTWKIVLDAFEGIPEATLAVNTSSQWIVVYIVVVVHHTQWD
jgi:hypothetical protein